MVPERLGGRKQLLGVAGIGRFGGSRETLPDGNRKVPGTGIRLLTLSKRGMRD